jgi:hypothetical protein
MTTAALVRPATTSGLNQPLSYSETHFGSIEPRREWCPLGKSMLSTLLPPLMIAPPTASCQIEDVAHLVQKLQRDEPMGTILRITGVFRRPFAAPRLLCFNRRLE